MRAGPHGVGAGRPDLECVGEAVPELRPRDSVKPLEPDQDRPLNSRGSRRRNPDRDQLASSIPLERDLRDRPEPRRKQDRERAGDSWVDECTRQNRRGERSSWIERRGDGDVAVSTQHVDRRHPGIEHDGLQLRGRERPARRHGGGDQVSRAAFRRERPVCVAPVEHRTGRRPDSCVRRDRGQPDCLTRLQCGRRQIGVARRSHRGEQQPQAKSTHTEDDDPKHPGTAGKNTENDGGNHGESRRRFLPQFCSELLTAGCTLLGCRSRPTRG